MLLMLPLLFSNSELTVRLGLSWRSLGLGLSHSVDLSESSRGMLGLEISLFGLKSINIIINYRGADYTVFVNHY